MIFNSRNALTALGISSAFVLVFAFQNCAPALPLEGVISANSVRATPTPGTGATPAPGGGGTYTGNDIDGSCSDNTTTEPMASRYVSSVAGGNLIAFRKSGGISAFWKVNGGNVLHGVVCMISASWDVAALGDFNADGQTDVLWKNTNGQVAVWLMNGAIRISTGLAGTIGAGWEIIGTGNLDGDGKHDVVWREVSTGNIKKWVMRGAAAPTEIDLGNIPTNFVVQGLGDFDGNFRADILSRDASGNLRITALNAAGTVASTVNISAGGAATTPAVAAGWSVKAVGDFNGDTRADLVIQNDSSGAMEIRYMIATPLNAPTTASLQSTPFQLTLENTSWSLLYAADVNSDFVSDWVWTIPNATDTYLAYTPLLRTPGTTATLDVITSGYTVFTYGRF